MNPVLAEIMNSGSTILPNGEIVPVHSGSDSQSGTFLQEMIDHVHPSHSLEVGLAFGVSTLFILDAIRKYNGRLIGMDPAQNDSTWRGGGLHNIKRAGYDGSYEFHEDVSERVLPKLLQRGERLDFAYIDGWATFDHVLVDFFYIDRMLQVGGVIVLNDVGFPSIKRVCDFILTNRGYEVLDQIRSNEPRGMRNRFKQFSAKVFHPFVRTDKTPSKETMKIENQISEAYFLAIKKVSEDDRRWDHFVPF
jgi:predicted O-methyltransferase YrrM